MSGQSARRQSHSATSPPCAACQSRRASKAPSWWLFTACLTFASSAHSAAWARQSSAISASLLSGQARDIFTRARIICPSVWPRIVSVGTAMIAACQRLSVTWSLGIRTYGLDLEWLGLGMAWTWTCLPMLHYRTHPNFNFSRPNRENKNKLFILQPSYFMRNSYASRILLNCVSCPPHLSG
jgi:hypothetical protein